jgi:protein-tyrosine phosphatase
VTADDARLGEELTRLASADNFRDLAGPGYTNADGQPLRAGVLWRSNELQLLDEDAATLTALDIGAVYDLRSSYEVEAHPDIELPHATWHHVEVGGIPPGAGAELPDAAAALAEMFAVYRRFVTDADARKSFGTLLRGLATSSRPQVFHCTAGKDRTGWAAALVLHVAGVSDEVIVADYLLTNERSAGTRAKYLGMIADHLGADRVSIFEPTFVADVTYLRAAQEQAVASYGSIGGYLRDGLGLEDDVIAALRARLLDGPVA